MICCKKEREANARLGKQRFSKLLAPAVSADDDDDDNDDDESRPSDIELSHPVKELCKTIDAFIYVVDSSADSHRVNLGDTELSAMMNENWTQAKAPLLVLSCVSTATTPSLSCATVVELLQLRRLNRPWQVNAACVENLDGVLSGIKWLLSSSS
ncbi:common myeloid progenitor cell proliferation [Desmophyllum pertusum]|uniref:Common myeloid progenitor cell proliferation n=1 Tax=Desmophyllum pertusum TaxID=174260 RepID=A0A9X0CJ81_9CNID|nr:common myeloid progenitor cell proliferation [Desmophyllum pertusum]